MLKYLRATAAAIIAAAFVLGAGQAALAAPQDLIVKAQRVLDDLKTDPDFKTFQESVKTAKGILVIPMLLKAGFFFGIEGGNGVLLARNDKGEWSHPAFYTLGGGSFGLQIGVQSAAVAFVIRTEKGLDAIITSEVKLGVDGSISIGTFGKGVEGSTTLGLGGDILAYSKSSGAFIGVALEGAVIHKRNDLNKEYYGDAAATPRAIVLEGGHANPKADGLRKTLAGY